jgi:hypothetical protein
MNIFGSIIIGFFLLSLLPVAFSSEKFGLVTQCAYATTLPLLFVTFLVILCDESRDKFGRYKLSTKSKVFATIAILASIFSMIANLLHY